MKEHESSKEIERYNSNRRRTVRPRFEGINVKAFRVSLTAVPVLIACSPAMAAGNAPAPFLGNGLVFLIILLALASATSVGAVFYVHSLFDQKCWDRVDLNEGRALAQAKMRGRLLFRRIGLACMLPGCLAAAVLGWMSMEWFGFVGVFNMLVGLVGGMGLISFGLWKFALHCTYITYEEKVDAGLEPDINTIPSDSVPASEQPEAGPWMVRLVSGKTFQAKSVSVIAEAVKQGKLPEDTVVQAPGSSNWRPLGEILG